MPFHNGSCKLSSLQLLLTTQMGNRQNEAINVLATCLSNQMTS